MPYIYFFKEKESISLLNIFIGHLLSVHPAQGLFIRKNSKNEITVCALEGVRIQLREVSHILMWEHIYYFLWSNANWCSISCTVVERSAQRQSLPLSLKLWKTWITCMSSAQGKDLFICLIFLLYLIQCLAYGRNATNVCVMNDLMNNFLL